MLCSMLACTDPVSISEAPTPTTADVRGGPWNPDLSLNSTSVNRRIHPLTSARK